MAQTPPNLPPDGYGPGTPPGGYPPGGYPPGGYPPESFPPASWPARPTGADEHAHPGYPGYPQGYPAYPGDEEKEFKLRDLIDVAYRGRWVILATLLLVAVPIAVYTFLLPNQYQSYSLLLVDKEAESELTGILPSGQFWGSGTGRLLGNEVLVLKQSYALAEATARRLLELGATPEGRPLTILAPEGGAEEEPPPSAHAVAGRLQGRYLKVALEETNLNMLRITATSTVPEEAALIANLYAEAYQERTREASRASVAASRAFLEEQVDSLAVELASREEAVRSFMSREGAVRLDAEADMLVGQLSTLQAQRDEARIAAQMKASRIAELERELQGIEPRLTARLAAGTEAEAASVQARIRALQDRLEQIYLRNPELREASPAPPEVADLQRQIEALRAQAAAISDQLLQDALATGGVDASTEGIARVAELRRRLVDERIELSGLEAQIATINGRIGGYEADLGRIPTQSIELARLTRDRQSTERLAVALEERLQEARLAEQSELGYAEVIRPAFASAVPVAPNRPRNVVFGVLIGLMLGFALAFVRTTLDHRIHRPDDLREKGYGVLGTIPDVGPLVKEEFQGADAVRDGDRTFSTALTALLSPMSQASEAYRALRTSIQFARLDAVVQTVVVTSPSPGEGKTTTAANLAVVMAQAGRRVLLVDADLRRPNVHKLLGANKAPGLVDHLFDVSDARAEARAAQAEGRDAGGDLDLPSGPVPTGIEDVDVLPAGRAVPFPSEVLGSPVLRERLEAWRQRYDVIVVDTPPVLAATDAVLLSTQADATVVVVKMGQTKDFELERALEVLRSVGGRVVGVVANGFDPERSYGYKYRYTYGYRQQYGYGRDEVEAERQKKREARAKA